MAQVPPVPLLNSWVQVVGFIAILVYMAYGQWLTKENAKAVKSKLDTAAEITAIKLDAAAKTTSDKIDHANSKTDDLHSMWNSRLDEFKKMVQETAISALEAHQKESEAQAAKLRAEHEKHMLMERGQFEARILSLEKTISAQQALIPPPSPTIVPVEPVPVTPEKRLEEIRGHE